MIGQSVLQSVEEELRPDLKSVTTLLQLTEELSAKENLSKFKSVILSLVRVRV